MSLLNKKCKYEFFLEENYKWIAMETRCPKCNDVAIRLGTFDDQGNQIATEEDNRAVKRRAEINRQKLANQPKCPTCQSTNIHKIGGTERVVFVATLGLFSKKINKTFKCNSCGYTW